MAPQSTPHISPGDTPIAETILLPGDPRRAQFIANQFLDDVQQFNDVRNMLGFTGTYRGTPVSVMGTGMGMPSMGIYSHELIHTFGVKNLIRIGSCGALQKDMQLYDIVLAQGASTDSNYMQQFGVRGSFAPLASFDLLAKARAAADQRGARSHVGNILSSDVFYNADPESMTPWTRLGVLAVEMETAALYANAAAAGVNALALFTVSDHLLTHATTTPAERETAFTAMIEVGLELL